MADGDNKQMPNRQFRNMQGLLNFCTQVTVQEDNTQDTTLNPLSRERKEFLEHVLSGMHGNVAKCMANCLQKLTQTCVDNANDNVSEQEEALDELAEYVEDINYALDLCKINGFPIIVHLLECPHASLQTGAAQVIGNVCQNNEVCQTHMIPLQVMQKILNIVDNHKDPDCKVKALYALSCLTREFEPAEHQFIESSGFCYLMRAIQTKIPKLIIKSLFLLQYFIERSKQSREILLSMGLVDKLVSLLIGEDVDSGISEVCSLCLLNLSCSDKRAIKECLRTEFRLVSHLKERQKYILGKENLQDECNHIEGLLGLLEAAAREEEQEDSW